MTRIWRDAGECHQRVEGRISDDGRLIDSRWEASQDGKLWELEFDLTYTRWPDDASGSAPRSVLACDELHQPIPGFLELGRHEIGSLGG
jgi:hypothetical protein